MFCAAIQEFAYSLPLDNGLLIADVKNGEPINNVEILSLMAIAEALFVTVTIESRTLDRIDACHQLWSEAAGLFSELCDSWAGIESDDPQVKWLRCRLTHFAELCRDRTSLYNISEQDRSEYAERRGGLPDEGLEPQQETVREFSKLETASIERAYRRL